MDSNLCSFCRLPKAVLACEVCANALCKKCVVILPKESFSFLETIPEDLRHKNYCGSCYDEKVAPELTLYRRTFYQAKKVNVFVKGQGEEIRLMSQNQKPLKVVDCVDKDETLLRLAFLAARAGFNTLVNVDISHKKVRNEGYQTTKWQGSGVPTQTDLD